MITRSETPEKIDIQLQHEAQGTQALTRALGSSQKNKYFHLSAGRLVSNKMAAGPFRLRHAPASSDAPPSSTSPALRGEDADLRPVVAVRPPYRFHVAVETHMRQLRNRASGWKASRRRLASNRFNRQSINHTLA